MFAVSDNMFTGSLPSEGFIKWTKLYYFEADVNRLSSSLPEEGFKGLDKVNSIEPPPATNPHHELLNSPFKL
eukprot:1190043-Amphidinium_carterae.2